MDNKNNEDFSTGLFDLPELSKSENETKIEENNEVKTIDQIMENIEEKDLGENTPIETEEEKIEETKELEKTTEDSKEEKTVVVVKKKEKKVANFFSILASIIGIFAIVVFLFFLISSYSNFNDVKNCKKPSNYKEKTHYTKKGRDVTYYKYTIYKIEIIKYEGEVTYTLKPAFMDDY